jgi:hypothetical protein
VAGVSVSSVARARSRALRSSLVIAPWDRATARIFVFGQPVGVPIKTHAARPWIAKMPLPYSDATYLLFFYTAVLDDTLDG